MICGIIASMAPDSAVPAVPARAHTHLDDSTTIIDEISGTWAKSGTLSLKTGGKFGARCARFPYDLGYAQKSFGTEYPVGQDYTVEGFARFEAGGLTGTGLTTLLKVGNNLARVSWSSTSSFSWHLGNQSGVITAGDVVTLNTAAWYHVAMVRAAGVMKLFIDGVLTLTHPNADSIAPNTIYFGLADSPEERPILRMDEIRFTPAAIYSGNFSPPSAPF